MMQPHSASSEDTRYSRPWSQPLESSDDLRHRLIYQQNMWLAECYFKQTITWMEAILHGVDMENVPFVQSSFIYLNLSAGILPSTASPCYMSIYNFRSRLERILQIIKSKLQGSLEFVREPRQPSRFAGIIRGIFMVSLLPRGWILPSQNQKKVSAQAKPQAQCLSGSLLQAPKLLRSCDFSKGPAGTNSAFGSWHMALCFRNNLLEKLASLSIPWPINK